MTMLCQHTDVVAVDNAKCSRTKLGGRDSNPDSRLQRPESCH